MNTISKFRWFWAWQDEKEEEWLHEMATQGFHLLSIGVPGFYEFKIGEPRNDYYRMDFITDRKDYRNYLQLFKDAGWEHLGEMGGWQYFRTKTEGNTIPEIYTDKDSKAIKYQRLIAYLTIFLPIMIVTATRPVTTNSEFAGLYMTAKMFMVILLLVWAYAMVMIFRRIQQIKGR